jgi:putative tryptophan/tyrosine transport system substrate-binding protein
MSYTADFSSIGRQQGIYAGRILKGGKPAELPVLQVTKMDFAGAKHKLEIDDGLFPNLLLGHWFIPASEIHRRII